VCGYVWENQRRGGRQAAGERACESNGLGDLLSLVIAGCH